MTVEDIQVEHSWEFTAPSPVASVAAFANSPRVLVTTFDGMCCLLDEDGSPAAEIELGAAVSDTCVSGDGQRFAVLTQEGMLTGFDIMGETVWDVEVGPEVTCFDLGLSGRRILLARPPRTVAYVSPGTGREEQELDCSHDVASVALAEENDDCALIGGQVGELSLWTPEGEPLWNYDIGATSGRVRLSHATGIVVYPVYEEGVQTFTLDGEGAGAFDLGAPVTAGCAAPSPDGPLLGVVTEERIITLMDLEGVIAWHHEFQTSMSAFDFADDAARILGAVGDLRVFCFELHVPGSTQMDVPPAEGFSSATEAPTVDETVSEVPVDQVQEEEEESSPIALGAPRPKGADLLAELPMPELPGELSQIFVSPEGQYIVAVSVSGDLVALTRDGDVLLRTTMGSPAHVLKKRTNSRIAVWQPEGLVGVELEEGKAWRLPLGPPSAVDVDCTERLDLIGTVDEAGQLTLMRRDGKKLAGAQVKPSPKKLYMAPSGGTILTLDEEERFRFFDARGNLQRKQRIAGEEHFEHVILEDGFCAMGGSNGRIIVQDMGGKVLWTDRVVDEIVRMESLENTIAIYDADGTCLVLNPYGEVMMEFKPPPGLSLLRTPPGQDPILVCGRRNVLTVYGGYHRKLNARWSFRCPQRIRVFEADLNADTVAIASGDRIWVVEGSED